MERKRFLRVLATIPLISIPWAKVGAKGQPCHTQADAEGPFYKADAPERELIERDGVPLKIEGRVLSSDCESPIADAILDIWHCNQHGEYDMEGFRGRGLVKTDAEGKYQFITIFPPPYMNRPRHIHVKVRAKGKKELTTQLYFKGDQRIKNDFARNAREDRVIALSNKGDMKTGVFNIWV